MRSIGVEATLPIAIVGHIDHGKSTLIGRLLYDADSLPSCLMEEIKQGMKESGKPAEFAYIMDHLEEERMEKMTIDTAQSFFKTDKRHYAIIDTPGHVEFIKNMITGTSQAEAAILIVSALEGMEEQTKRHAYILGMLGLKQVILAINKMDLVNYSHDRFEELKCKVSSFLHSLEIKPNHAIPISARVGDNIAKAGGNMRWYNGPTIFEALDKLKTKEDSVLKPLRFPIQDTYILDQKKILVGRVVSGKAQRGNEVLILPSKAKTRIESIEVYQDTKDVAEAGESIGIVLKDELTLKRGEVICDLQHPSEIETKINANIFWMLPKPLQAESQLTIRCATAEECCHIERIEERIDSSTLEIIENDSNILRETEVGKVTISIDSPMVFEDFNETEELGRFVLTRSGEICAGGIINSPISL
ncbi:MAG: GTP-binding protein [Desulfobacterales bacterium]|nr:GTP-binding protein [Desulfobacterales bacterium]